MKQAKRYPLATVFVVVLCINLSLFLMAYLIVAYLRAPGTEDSVDNMMSRNALLKEVCAIVYHTLFFYFSLNYFNKLLVEKKSTMHYVGFCALLFVVSLGYFFGVSYILPQKITVQGTMDKSKTFALYLFSYSISSSFFAGLSLLLAYLNNLRAGQKQRKILEAQKMQLEVDKSQANFKFLKSQINPHFLHNTLNFLYAKSLPYSSELSEGILTLSDIMRYALNEPAGTHGMALLKDEIEHVRDVIKINQLRFSNNLHVNFEVHGVINGAQIIPFVLITIVENAFKHGDLQKPEFPIDIKLSVEHKRLFFYCRNRKKSGPKEISTGLGLDNIRNRLDFAYGSNYTLLIKDEAEFYTTELTIDTL
ncbi:sensor histidine kinase [Ferruginibacter sp.]